MNRALKLALAAAAVVLIVVYAAMPGGRSDAAIPTKATSSARVDSSATPTLMETSGARVELAEEPTRRAVAAGDIGAPIQVRGRVVDEIGRPIEVFAVHAIHRDVHNMFIETRDWPTAIHAHGEFELEGLALGYWDIAPTADGLTLANLRSFGASPPVRVDFVMRGDAVLIGRVVDPDGNPVPNANLSLDGRQSQAGADGAFEFNVATGTHKLRADAPGFAQGDEHEVRVVTGDKVAGIELALKRWVIVRGVALAEDGAPLSGWFVSANREGAASLSTKTDDAGRFELPVGGAATWDLYVYDTEGEAVFSRLTTAIQVTAVGTMDVALRIARERGVKLSGTVVSTTNPPKPPAAKVSAATLDGRLTARDGSVVSIDRSAHFEMNLRSPGRYLLRLRGVDGAELSSQVIEVPDRDVFEVTLEP